MRKLIKAAGLNYRTSAEEIYQISTKLTPQQIAFRQIIIYGLKKVDVASIQRNRTYSFYDPCQTRPFISQFQKIFNSIGKDDRKKIILK